MKAIAPPKLLSPPNQHRSTWIKPEVTVKGAPEMPNTPGPPHTARSQHI